MKQGTKGSKEGRNEMKVGQEQGSEENVKKGRREEKRNQRNENNKVRKRGKSSKEAP